MQGLPRGEEFDLCLRGGEAGSVRLRSCLQARMAGAI